jgi:DNA mismatch repair protein MutL
LPMSDTQSIPRIKRLSSSLANQIAAGEVIERPASVLKELLENSLDAGATRITIDISKAGSQLIRVTDNGHGIHPDDLQLALERHATAKLNSQSDLAAIRSLGFRGEALPSISSVAAITLTSGTAGIEQAARLKFDPLTNEFEFKPAAHPVGTTVEVRNLFHNTPARKKFLRSERTEFLHLQEIARRIALSRFDFTMELRHNDQNVINCRAVTTDSDVRVASIMGRSFIDNAVRLDYDAGDMRIWGWLGTGDLARSSTDRQYLYLNGRMIHDRRINHAIRMSCEGQLAEGRFPTYLLYLEMDVSAADVNVHPTKHEVRFRHARNVHDFIYAGLSSALSDSQDLYKTLHQTRLKNDEPVLSTDNETPSSRRHNVVGDVRSSYGELYARRQTELISDIPALGQVLVQMQDNYMLTKRDTAFLLVNIGAAKKHMALTALHAVNQGKVITNRPLLVPVSYKITTSQEKTLFSITSLLERYSLVLELSGPGICRVRAMPNLLAYADIALLVEDLLKLKMSGKSSIEIENCLIEIMANHVNDIPNPSLSSEEMMGLLRQLADSGLDVTLARHPPIWSSLCKEDLDAFIRRDHK